MNSVGIALSRVGHMEMDGLKHIEMEVIKELELIKVKCNYIT